MSTRLLEGVRVAEFAMFETGGIGTVLADLGAEVIKVERPGAGDPVRHTAWPFIHGESIMHRHLGRGKRGVAIDIQNPEGADVARHLMLSADIVVEGMRPGVLGRYGLGHDRIRAVKPELVWCAATGYGLNGPYANLGAHGLAFDSWAGLLDVTTTDDGFATGSLRLPLGTRATPVLGAAAVLAGIIRARSVSKGCVIDIAQSEAALALDWLTVEGHRAHQRPESEVTGNPNDGGHRREPGTAGMGDSVRYQVYPSADGYILFMATETKFWVNFCQALDRSDLLVNLKDAPTTSHAVGDKALRRELTELFSQRTTAEWVELGLTANVPIAPVNDARTVGDDPHFLARMGWLPREEYGADLIPLPVHLVGDELARPKPAPEIGEDTDAVLAELGITNIEHLRSSGAIA